MVKRQYAQWASAVCAVVWSVAVLWVSPATAVPLDLNGKFEILTGEVSTHTPGKVKLMEFADFYCPHCHHFDETGLPLLVKEFGNKLEITMVGYPVIRGKLPTAFDMYEQAKMMGKGNEMKTVLFRTIHKDKIDGVLDRSIREAADSRKSASIRKRLKTAWPAESRPRPLKTAGGGESGLKCRPLRRSCWTAISKSMVRT